MSHERLIYVALGDSIATGCLTYWASTDGYPAYIARALARRRPVQLQNHAVNGDTSGRLLWRLTHCQGLRRAIAQAGLITLSIGGNDLLHAASIPGFTSICSAKAWYGVNQFLQNYPRIIAEIRSLNRQAPLIAMTIYNPYCCSQNLGGAFCDRGLHEFTERCLAGINQLIETNTCDGYMVADVHSAFARYRFGRMGRVVALYPADGCFLLRNPHPTPCGHRLIAREHLKALDFTR